MISHLDRDGLRTAQQIIMCALNLLFVSLLPVAVGSLPPRRLLRAAGQCYNPK